MKTTRKSLLYGLIGMLAVALPASAADIAGQWQAEFDTQIGVQKYDFNFQMKDGKLTAKAVAETGDQKRDVVFKEAKLEGDTLTFTEMRQIQNREIRIEYTGKVQDKVIKFTRKVGDFGSQKSEATRAPRRGCGKCLNRATRRAAVGGAEVSAARFNSAPMTRRRSKIHPRDSTKYGQTFRTENSERVDYDSKTVGVKRWMQVYTPPSYSPENKYPVLYVLHGIGGNERQEWTRQGVAHVILDNLIADKKIEPMIAVFPNGNATANTKDEAQRGRGGFGGWGTPFENDLIKDIIPFIESHYSVLADREHRALAGLSMGGGQSLNFGLGNLNVFAWVGGFSSAPNTKSPEQLVPNPDEAVKQLKLLYISCGNKDGLIRISQGVHAYLKQKNVPHIWHVDDPPTTFSIGRRDSIIFPN